MANLLFQNNIERIGYIQGFAIEPANNKLGTNTYRLPDEPMCAPAPHGLVIKQNFVRISK